MNRKKQRLALCASEDPITHSLQCKTIVRLNGLTAMMVRVTWQALVRRSHRRIVSSKEADKKESSIGDIARDITLSCVVRD